MNVPWSYFRPHQALAWLDPERMTQQVKEGRYANRRDHPLMP